MTTKIITLKNLVQLFLATVMVTISYSSMAVNVGFLKNAPISYYTDADKSVMMERIYKVLDELKDGSVTEWKNKSTQHSGLIAILSTEIDKNTKQKCRSINLINQEKYQKVSMVYKFCLDKNKTPNWKVVN